MPWSSDCGGALSSVAAADDRWNQTLELMGRVYDRGSQGSGGAVVDGDPVEAKRTQDV